MSEFACFVAAEVRGVGVRPRAQTAITKITIVASIVRTSNSVSRIFVGERLMTLGAALEVFSCIIFSQSHFEVSSFLRSKDSYFFTDCIIPLKTTLSSSFYFERALDLSLSLSDDCFNMGGYALLSNQMPAWPLIGLCFIKNWVLDVLHFQLFYLAEWYSILFEDQLVSDSHVELVQLYVVGDLRPFVGKSHLLWSKFLGKFFEDKFLELESRCLP